MGQAQNRGPIWLKQLRVSVRNDPPSGMKVGEEARDIGFEWLSRRLAGAFNIIQPINYYIFMTVLCSTISGMIPNAEKGLRDVEPTNQRIELRSFQGWISWWLGFHLSGPLFQAELNSTDIPIAKGYLRITHTFMFDRSFFLIGLSKPFPFDVTVVVRKSPAMVISCYFTDDLRFI
jgi:hypothetical protein